MQGSDAVLSSRVMLPGNALLSSVVIIPVWILTCSSHLHDGGRSVTSLLLSERA